LELLNIVRSSVGWVFGYRRYLVHPEKRANCKLASGIVGLLHNAFRPLGLCVWLSVLKVGEIYLIPCNVLLRSFSLFFYAFSHQTYVNQSVNFLTSGKLTNCQLLGTEILPYGGIT
jgi:hypothetical protein